MMTLSFHQCVQSAEPLVFLLLSFSLHHSAILQPVFFLSLALLLKATIHTYCTSAAHSCPACYYYYYYHQYWFHSIVLLLVGSFLHTRSLICFLAQMGTDQSEWGAIIFPFFGDFHPSLWALFVQIMVLQKAEIGISLTRHVASRTQNNSYKPDLDVVWKYSDWLVVISVLWLQLESSPTVKTALKRTLVVLATKWMKVYFTRS